MKFDPRIGLQKRACGRCRWRGRGSAGERCPSCGAYAEEYGPVFFGYEQRWTTMANRRSDGALVRISSELSFDDDIDFATAVLVETWKPRREPWNFQWDGPPRA